MITVNLKSYDEFTRKVWQIVVDKSLNRWIKEAIIQLEWKVKLEQRSQKVFDTWKLMQWYETRFSHLRGELYNTRKYGLFQHEWYKQQVWRYVPAIWKRLVKPYIKGRPWFTDALRDNSKIPEKAITQELLKTLSKLWI